jgi:hypothetical protein
MNIYQDASCLPMVKFEDKLARIVGTTFGYHSRYFDTRNRRDWSRTRYFDLYVKQEDGTWKFTPYINESRTIPCPKEEPVTEQVSVAQSGWGRVIDFEIAKQNQHSAESVF